MLHVIARGHEGRALFASDEDREFFTARMAAVFARTGTTCLARIVHQTPRRPEPGGRLSSREPRRGLPNPLLRFPSRKERSRISGRIVQASERVYFIGA